LLTTNRNILKICSDFQSKLYLICAQKSISDKEVGPSRAFEHVRTLRHITTAADYGLDADPIAKYMANAEKTVESKEALHKKLEAELAKPSMSVFVGMRDKSPVARAVFTDQFMSTYKKFLSSTTLASIYRLKPGRVVFTNEARSEFGQQGARLALSSEPMTNPELQLVADDKVTKCAEMSKKWEDDTGITKQKEIVEGKCGFGCA
jgi:hypothetical protein